MARKQAKSAVRPFEAGDIGLFAILPALECMVDGLEKERARNLDVFG
jgi:hypothetical protein